MTTTPKSRIDIIREIRNSDTTYFVRNETQSRVTCSTISTPFSLGPKGQGEDVVILPKEALDEPGFQRMWNAGKLTVTDDPNIENEMIQSALAVQEREDRKHADLDAQIEEPSSNRDLITKKCLISGETVYQSVADEKNMVPPLAPAYKDRAHEFTPTVSVDDKGNEVVTFSRITIDKE